MGFSVSLGGDGGTGLAGALGLVDGGELAIVLGLLADVAGDADLELLEHGHGVLVDDNTVVNLLVDERDLGGEVHTALALLLLELQGDSADGALGEALDDVGGVTGDLVAELLGGHDGGISDDALVDVVVLAELVEVLLHDETGSALHGLGTDVTHGLTNF